jgi:arylsulfatase A-like enzyme
VARPLRYTFILALAALGTALAAVGGWRYARASAPINGPIIVISVDTLRADHLPPYGYRHVRTPAIDALAADGVVFERAYAHAPQTLPAHVSMLSGRLPFQTGVRDEAGVSVTAGERLLPQLLRDRGYTTGGIVSTSLLRRETGVNQGFDFFDAEMPEDDPTERDGAESESVAERWLDQQRSSRVFLFLHLNEPHAPYTPPARFADYAPYDGEIAYADDIVGRLMHYLKTHQLYDQSTIVLLSDHGEGLGDHGEQEHGLFVYDEVLHVPFIVKQAANASAGRRVADLVQQVDLVPTILDLVKAPVPGNLQGRSLKPLLDGAEQLSEQPAYAEALFGRIHFGWSELTTIFDGRYRYVRAPREELYDLPRDPRERENIADAGAPAQQALRDALDGLTGRPAPSEQPEPDPKDKVEILETYRSAMALGGERKWNQAIALLQSIVKSEPEMTEVWNQIATFAMCIDRYEVAQDAYHHVSALEPSNAGAYLGAASALMKQHKLDDARDRAERATRVASPRDAGTPAAAHALLARIALARHDAEDARQEAVLARQADPTLPMPAFVDGRLLYDEGKLEEALLLFEQGIAEIRKAHTSPMPELHFYAADTLARLQRFPEAETHYVEELRAFPQNTRARAGLATLYQATDRPDEVSRVLSDLTRVTPTPDSYALAARLWKTFGNRRQADAVRAEAHRAFGEPSRSARH